MPPALEIQLSTPYRRESWIIWLRQMFGDGLEIFLQVQDVPLFHPRPSGSAIYVAASQLAPFAVSAVVRLADELAVARTDWPWRGEQQITDNRAHRAPH